MEDLVKSTWGKVKIFFIEGNELQNLMRNPNQIKQKMGQFMDPQMLEQFGGMENMMEMMKKMGQMEKSGELGDLSQMMKGMGGMGGLGGMGKKSKRRK